MADSNSNTTETSIKLASSLLPEIQQTILELIIKDFLCFVNYNTGFSYEGETIVKLKTVEVFGDEDGLAQRFTNPNIMKLLEFHSHYVRLSSNRFTFYKIPDNCFYLKFINHLWWPAYQISKLLEWNLVNKLTSLTTLSLRLDDITELSRIEEIMEHLQFTVPSMKIMYLEYTYTRGTEWSEDILTDILVQANTFVIKHKNNKVNIKFDITLSIYLIWTMWRLDSKTQLSLPRHTAYPMDTKKVDKIGQWCSVSGIIEIHAIAKSNTSFTNSEPISFPNAINSTVSTVYLGSLSTKYEKLLDGFSSLKTLRLYNMSMNKFPSLTESLRELTICSVKVLTISDGIILPPQLCCLYLYGNMSCFTLPVIINVEELVDLKTVFVNIDPLKFSDRYDEDTKFGYFFCLFYR
ncbi:unnamed protein product [Ambrosiozyma monospora]|uniref:Unnamed protein product n=1 Tax=Ambrosiozyma monospora TaxID=43982 RepID=A0ACB5T9S3_AMBMO|nr:unnamed protein product [Ambrosiozyma monospora]